MLSHLVIKLNDPSSILRELEEICQKNNLEVAFPEYLFEDNGDLVSQLWMVADKIEEIYNILNGYRFF